MKSPLQKKAFQDLDLNNSFLFAAAMEDEAICQIVLEIILGFKIPRVSVHAEHSILVSSDFRSVRLDVYANDGMCVNYNVEAQNENEGDLPKRSRYHQAEIDVSSLKPGEDFRDLKPGYVIFICAFDPFGEGLYRYTFEERCLERSIPLGDGTRKIFLNTKGRNTEEVPEELIHFLNYMEQSTDEYVAGVEDDSIIHLHEKVAELKKWRDLEARYMTFEELVEGKERRAKAEGKAESILQILQESGEVPEELADRIIGEKNEEVLKRWLKLAVTVSNIGQFSEEM